MVKRRTSTGRNLNTPTLIPLASERLTVRVHTGTPPGFARSLYLWELSTCQKPPPSEKVPLLCLTVLEERTFKKRKVK